MGFLNKPSIVQGNSLNTQGNFGAKQPAKSPTKEKAPSSYFSGKQTPKKPVEENKVFKSLIARKKEDNSGALFGGKTVWARNVDKALKKMEYKEKWNNNPLTKMDHEDFERLKKIIKDPKYTAGGITDAELKWEQKKWDAELKLKNKKLNPFDGKDLAEIKRQRREQKFFKKLKGGK